MEQNKGAQKEWSALGLLWSLGYAIAVPLVLCALGGRLLDRRFDTSPLFLLIGLFFSVTVSAAWVYRKIIEITTLTKQK